MIKCVYVIVSDGTYVVSEVCVLVLNVFFFTPRSDYSRFTLVAITLTEKIIKAMFRLDANHNVNIVNSYLHESYVLFIFIPVAMALINNEY